MNTEKLAAIFAELINKYGKAIEEWFMSQSKNYPPVVYTSLDIRNSGFKFAPVDVNFFPAGFNNLTQESQAEASAHLKILLHDADKILLVIENHDRNLNYLRNALELQKILQNTGKKVHVANFVNTELRRISLPNGETLEVDGLKTDGSKISTLSGFRANTIVINNDMSDGLPEILRKTNTQQRILPNPQGGWFNRRKATFFQIYRETLERFGQEFKIDPWFFYPITTEMDSIDFKNQDDLQKVKIEIQKIIDQTQQKYDKYKIRWTQPYCFIKSNTGTYGLGVTSVDSAEGIFSLNKKERQNMDTGKSGVKIDSIIIQEGIPTIEKLGPATAERTIYLTNGHVVGGFFRANQGKNSRINLNSQSSFFQPLTPATYSTPLVHFIAKVTHLSVLIEASKYSNDFDIDISNIANAENILNNRQNV